MESLIVEIVPTAITGRLVRTTGVTASATGFRAPLGALAEIERDNAAPIEAEVVGFQDELTILFPFESLQGASHGSQVKLRNTKNWLGVGPALLGRVVDARGLAIDGRTQPVLRHRVPLDAKAPHPIARPRITKPLSTGIRAIDGLLTCGKGQRMGIFAGSGVGKSVTLGMLARHATADVNVIALVGERGREVNEFIERDLRDVGLAKSIVVVATSDEPAVLRRRAAFAATAIAEFFRDQGADVLLLMDSLTRFALAQREIALATGELPATRGYPPSVFALLPKLVERAGCGPSGSITAFYSVLVEGDDAQEPISDALRGLLDGHTWLSRKLATRGHYPAIDILESLSRLMPEVAPASHRTDAAQIRAWMAAYRDHEDLISIGAYRPGTDALVDRAIAMREPIEQLLRQTVEESSTVEEAAAALARLRAIGSAG